ncbi:hypothetical protein HDU97_010127 [Phlyctochytrium planicorne]|nr:hypothetical protein HDU97_010127 [Phlyctochytrium planicorne]
MDVEILTVAGADSVVTGFPGLGPVLIQGICRITNHSAVRVTIKYISIELSGNTWGNGGTFTTDLSLIHGKRILYESTVPSSDLQLDPSGLLDLPFLFELQQDYASVLPPSLDTANLLSLDCHTQYNLKTILRCDLDSSNIVSSKIFRLPRFDIAELKQILTNHKHSTNGQSPDGGIKYTIMSPKAIVTGDLFSVDINVSSLNQRPIASVAVALVESVRISGDSGYSQAEASSTVFSWDTLAAGIQPSLAIVDKRDLQAPEWHTGKMSGPASTSQSGINPTSVSGGVELMHKFIFTIQVDGDPNPVTISAPISVVPVTKPMLDHLISQSDTIKISSDPGIASFGKFLTDFKNGVSEVPEAQLSDEEALARALALSMEDDIAKALMESEALYQAQSPNMTEEEAIRLAIAASMGGAEDGSYGSSGSSAEIVDPHAKFNPRTASIIIQRFGSLEAKKAFLMQHRGNLPPLGGFPSLRKVVSEFVVVNVDEMNLKVGDMVAVIKSFDDEWAEGYNVTSGGAGRFPSAVLGDSYEIPMATSPGIKVPWLNHHELKLVERRLDGLLSINEIAPADYFQQRSDLVAKLVV